MKTSNSYEERQALEWLDQVMALCSWDVEPDCEGTAMQQLESAYINTQDSYAEGVVSIIDQPAYLRSSLDDAAALAMLPPLPVYE
jgi:hypothetical protein